MRMRLEDMSPALKARVGESLVRQRVRAVQDGPLASGAAMTCSGTVERVTRERRAGSGGSNVIGAKCNRLHLLGKGIYEAVAGVVRGGDVAGL